MNKKWVLLLDYLANIKPDFVEIVFPLKSLQSITGSIDNSISTNEINKILGQNFKIVKIRNKDEYKIINKNYLSRRQ